MPLTIKVQGQGFMVVEEFFCLRSLIHSTTGSTCDINHRSAITRAVMQNLENQIWRSRLATSTKLKLYNTCILPIFLYGSDCWAISKTDARKIDALDQWCLRMLLGIKWYQFVRNNDVRRLTKQPKLIAIIQSRWITLFRHIVCMDDNADAKRILLASPPVDWRRQPGRPRIMWHCPTGSETLQRCTPWSSRFGSELPSVEDDVDVWRYAVLAFNARNDDDIDWVVVAINVGKIRRIHVG